MTDDEKMELMRLLGMFMAECHSNAVSKGWWDDCLMQGEYGPHPLEISNKLNLIHAEVSEATEALRDGQIRLYLERRKPEGMLVELADAFIRTADLVGKLGLVDEFIEGMLRKTEFNKTRPNRHGGKAL